MTRPFNQTDAVRDYIFPIAEIEQMPDETLTVRRWRGTGFFIGGNYALTAHHVISKAEQNLGILLTDGSSWRVFAIRRGESHSRHDIALLEIEPPGRDLSWTTQMSVTGDWSGSSQHYHTWGYPGDIMHEVVTNGIATPRPDLVYAEGYVRRRMTNIPLDNIRGDAFYELSTRAGDGYSGGPVFRRFSDRMDWAAFAIYVGERVSHDGFSVGYALRMDALLDWKPELLKGGSVVPPDASTTQLIRI